MYTGRKKFEFKSSSNVRDQSMLGFEKQQL